MDTMHAWALWRLVMFGLIALPFLVAAVVVGFRQSLADSSISSAGPETRTHPPRLRDPACGAGTLTQPQKYVPSTHQWWSGARPRHEASRRRVAQRSMAARGLPRACRHPGGFVASDNPKAVPMSNHKHSMLIFGAPAAIRPRGMPAGMAGSSRTFVDDVGAGSSQVSVETVAANLRTVMAQVEELIEWPGIGRKTWCCSCGRQSCDLRRRVGWSPRHGRRHEHQDNADSAPGATSRE